MGSGSFGEYRLASLAVDEPNGTGRIDDRWYPPRVLSEDCSVQLDSAPIPTAFATFIPGDPAELLGDDALASQQALNEAPHQLGITIQLFDDSAQRDEMAATQFDYYEVAGAMECGSGDSPFPWQQTEHHPTDYPGAAFESDGPFGGTIMMYLVGERVLLTIGTAVNVFATDDEEEATQASEAAVATGPAIDAQIERLRAAGLG